MSSSSAHDDTVRRDGDGGESAVYGEGVLLLVLDRGQVAQRALGAGSHAVVGRGEDCQLTIADAHASRRHARIDVGADGRASLVDLGSANGTLLDGRRIEPKTVTSIAPGASIEIGSTRILVVLPRRVAPALPLVSHSEFLARLHARAEAGTRSPFAVFRVRFAHTSLSTVEEVLAQAFGEKAYAGAYAAGEHEVLLDPCAPEAATRLAGALRASLASLKVDASVGVATSPRDGTGAEKLLARAAPVKTGAARGPETNGFFERVRSTLQRVAKSNLNVLVIGDTGTGKEVAARTIHALSDRASGPLVAINCAAFAETLLESELFGYERGAFTGAVAAKAGLLETANGGTLFLDELGEMPLGLQAKLLRVIEQREVQRLGALRARPLDVRFVAATNRVLVDAIARGAFRQDLYFRMNGFTLEIPRLAERRDEIEPLARVFIAEAARAQGLPPPELRGDALLVLQAHDWPGNVRELKNAIERAVVLCEGGEITPEDLSHLPTARGSSLDAASVPVASPSRPTTPTLVGEDDAWRTHPPPPLMLPRAGKLSPEEDRALIMRVLEQCGGNQTHAARLLNVSRRTLIARLDAHDLPRPRKA